MENAFSADFVKIGANIIPQIKKIKRILVIEDDEILVSVLELILLRAGYIFRTHRSAENILMLIEDFKPDLVLLDYNLPGLNGEMVCNQIKRCAETRMLPVIIFSGSSNFFLSVGKYGCDAFIGQPFAPQDLIREIEKHLSKVEVN